MNTQKKNAKAMKAAVKDMQEEYGNRYIEFTLDEIEETLALLEETCWDPMVA